MDEGRLEEIEANAADAWFISEVREDIDDLVSEVRNLRGRLQAVCDVLSDAAAFGDDIPAGKVLEAVRGQRAAVKKVPRIIEFAEIRAGDVLQVSFPPRGGLSDNWSMTHIREAIAYHLVDGDWITGDGQRLVSRSDDRAIIKRIASLG